MAHMRSIRRSAVAVAVLVAVIPCGVASAEESLAVAASSELSADRIRQHTVVLGSDALEGRAPGTPGGQRAAAYIAQELARLGIDPLGDERTFFQQVPIHGNVVLQESRLVLTILGEAHELELGADYLLYTTGAQTWLPRPVPIVFVGYGIVAPEFDYNDYADVDVRGKVVAYLTGEPDSDDPEFFLGEESSVYAVPETKQRIALSRGAVGSVLIPSSDTSGEGWERLRREFSFEHLTLAYSLPRHLSLVLYPGLAELLFADALYDFDQVRAMQGSYTLRSFHLPVSLTFEGAFRSRNFLAPNVVGWLEGSDPELSETALVLSAHYDHLGIGPEVAGDAIYNGVVDNAIGVAGVLEITRVLATRTGPPRRSLIFLFSTAEEEGNLGSKYFLDHPPVPHSRIIANINVDGLATRMMFDDVMGIGAELSELGAMLDDAARQVGLDVTETELVAAGHEAYARSDQAVFAEAGIPAILINEGFRWRGSTRETAIATTIEWLATVYHSPRDDLHQPLDFEASRQHCAVIAGLAVTVADSAREPQWRPGVPYAYQRLLSIANEPR